MLTEQHLKQGRITDGMTFSQRVWALTARVPPGRVTTYREIAKALDSKGYRAVGMAMHRNPHAPQVPCHRVVGSDGRLTGFASGVGRKRQMLAAEGVKVQHNRIDLARYAMSAAELQSKP